jgi:hydroxylysine kinase
LLFKASSRQAFRDLRSLRIDRKTWGQSRAHRGEVTAPKGLKVSDLTTKQDTGTSALQAVGDTLGSPPPLIDDAIAAGLVRSHYGLTSVAKALACERDATFQIQATSGQRFTLKLSNPAEAPLNTNFQTEAMLWMEQGNPDLPVPKMLRASDGRYEIPVQMADGRTSILRVLTWLEGIPVAVAGTTEPLRADMGRRLAELGLSLKGFDHPASSIDLQWDIKNAARLRPMIAALSDTALRAELLAELDHFDTEVQPALAGLRQQIIHNDFNLHNVLVGANASGKVSGVLDFGDMVKTPLVIDLAVAAAYMTHQPDGALRCVTDIVAGYHAVTPLWPEEIALLRDLIVARLMTTIAITEWRSARYPQNAPYILRNNTPARLGLERFATLPREDVTTALLRACKME